MTQSEISQLYERVAWLERKTVRLIYSAISAVSLFAGWIIADAVYGDGYGWPKAVVFFATWIILGIILQRMEFKGAPKHIEYIDP
jgi:hypothetical protein